MTNAIDVHRIGRDDLEQLVSDLRGSFTEADPHDPEIRNQFEEYWSPINGELQLATEPWAPRGAFSQNRLAAAFQAMKQWIARVTDEDRTAEHS